MVVQVNIIKWDNSTNKLQTLLSFDEGPCITYCDGKRAWLSSSTDYTWSACHLKARFKLLSMPTVRQLELSSSEVRITKLVDIYSLYPYISLSPCPGGVSYSHFPFLSPIFLFILLFVLVASNNYVMRLGYITSSTKVSVLWKDRLIGGMLWVEKWMGFSSIYLVVVYGTYTLVRMYVHNITLYAMYRYVQKYFL